MKKVALALLGLLSILAAFITAVWAAKGDLVGAPLAALFAYGAYSAFRKAGRIVSAPKAQAARTPESRPWER
jgi:hypothetical protein